MQRTVTRDNKQKSIRLDQSLYVKQVLEQFNMQQTRSVDTPTTNIKLSKHDCPPEHEQNVNVIKTYQSIVGSLMYLSLSTRPDIAYAVNGLSRFLTNSASIMDYKKSITLPKRNTTC